MTVVVVKLLVRVAVFVLVFAVAARRHEKIQVQPKVALPLVGLVFALLNTGLYWCSSRSFIWLRLAPSRC